MAEAAVRSRCAADSAKKGARGEEAACRYLERNGWALVARNYRAGRGEIDVVARRDGLLAFFEVKAWAAYGRESLEFAVGPAKRARILGAARAFLASRPGVPFRAVRFDVLLVGRGRIEHIEDAFGEVV